MCDQFIYLQKYITINIIPFSEKYSRAQSVKKRHSVRVMRTISGFRMNEQKVLAIFTLTQSYCRLYGVILWDFYVNLHNFSIKAV